MDRPGEEGGYGLLGCSPRGLVLSTNLVNLMRGTPQDKGCGVAGQTLRLALVTNYEMGFLDSDSGDLVSDLTRIEVEGL